MTNRLFLLPLLVILACAHKQQIIIVSGEVAVQLASQFEATSKIMDSGLEGGAVTQEQYDKWAKFGARFQQVYPLAVDMWQVANVSGDSKLEEQMLATINGLAIELVNFGVTK